MGPGEASDRGRRGSGGEGDLLPTCPAPDGAAVSAAGRGEPGSGLWPPPLGSVPSWRSGPTECRLGRATSDHGVAPAAPEGDSRGRDVAADGRW